MVVVVVDLCLVTVPEQLWDGSAAEDAVEAHGVSFSHLKVSGDPFELRLGVGLEDASLLLWSTFTTHRVPGERKNTLSTGLQCSP